MTADDIRRVAVVGAGVMGQGIAQVVASAGMDTRLFDASGAALESGVQSILGNVAKQERKGRISAEAALRVRRDLLSPCPNLREAVEGADLIIEAVPESREIKESLFEQLRGALENERVVVASNTSTFSITRLGRFSGRPGQFVGLHFFNPPPLMNLVEVIPGDKTTKETTGLALAFARKLKKTAILVRRDTPGFIVNRINAASFALFQNLAERGGLHPVTLDSAMRRHGWPMGPFELMDYIGLDVMVGMGDCFARALHMDYAPPVHLRDMVGRGMLGKKAGKGYHDWTQGRPEMEAGGGRSEKFDPLSAILVQFNEAVRLTQAGVCSEEEADLAMRLGNGLSEGPIETCRVVSDRDRHNRLNELAGQLEMEIFRPAD